MLVKEVWLMYCGEQMLLTLYDDLLPEVGEDSLDTDLHVVAKHLFTNALSDLAWLGMKAWTVLSRLKSFNNTSLTI